MELLLLAIVVILLFITVTLFLRGKKRFSALEYYARGNEAGFSVREAKDILTMAKLKGIADPTAALWNIRELDVVIRAFAGKYKADGKDRERTVLKFMEKLYAFRKKLEFDQPRYKLGIRSSRSIKTNQRIRVVVENMGVYSSTVVDSTDRYLVVSYPVGKRIPGTFRWKGAKVSVYFWRDEDAGYVFDSRVVDDLRVRGIPVLQLSHSDALMRAQKRKSLRVRSRMPAWLYLPRRAEIAYEKPERVPGLKCIVQDLSEDGLSVLIGGKAKVGMLVKAQFYIGEDQIVMSGSVKAAEYDSDKNQALLHIEAVEPSPRMKNIIRSHVYNVGGM